MSLVDMIQQLPVETVQDDEMYEALKEALVEYHRLIKEGILVPRGNNVSCLYSVPSISYQSNAK